MDKAGGPFGLPAFSRLKERDFYRSACRARRLGWPDNGLIDRPRGDRRHNMLGSTDGILVH